ncbi:MAG TPA: VWA domain-containing protein [Limnochordia bacterium]
MSWLPIAFGRPLWLLLLPLAALAVWLLWRAARQPGAPPHQRAAPWLRALACLAVLGALAQMEWLWPRPGTDVLFVLDESDSMLPEQRDRALRWIESQAADIGLGDRAGLITFGRQAYVEQGLDVALRQPSTAVTVDRSGTNLEVALRLAAATFPPRSNARIVLISDGFETEGRAESALGALRDAGIRIDAIALGSPPMTEVIAERLSVPSQVAPGEPFTAQAVISSAGPVEAQVRLFRNGELAGEERISLSTGRNLIEFGPLREQDGFATYEVRVDAPGDRFPQNNRAFGLVGTASASRFLLLTDDPVASTPFVSALRAQGLDVEVRPGGAAPTDTPELERYSAIILHDLPAMRLSTRQMRQIAHFVRDLGGGLVAIGGRHSFGLGGYFQTPVEEALPVSMDTPHQLIMPSLAMVLVIDRSGSMSETQGGKATKLDLAKEAALGVLDVLHDGDLVGVLTFESTFTWTVPLQPASDRQLFMSEIAALQADGGTDLYPALVEAEARLRSVRAMVKHLIILSDGRSKEGDFGGIVRQLSDSGITVSTVAIGDDADQTLLAQIARLGGGRYYFTEDIQAIPQIFTTEALVVSRSLAVERRFTPDLVQGADFLAGIEPTAIPPLNGYVVTSPKATATVHLTATEGNPLLASWRHGLGRAVAFTSAVTPPWAADWLAWPRFGAFWAQILRWVMRPASAEGITATLEFHEGRGQLLVDVLSDEGEYVNFLNLKADIVQPDGTNIEIDLEQVAPGHYTAAFEAVQSGPYIAAIRDPGNPRYAQPHITGGVIPYSPEYLVLRPPSALLERLTRGTGGRMIDIDDPTFSVFSTDGANRAALPIWPVLLAAALGLFLADVAVRYLPAGSLRAWRTETARASRRVWHAAHHRLSSLRHASTRTPTGMTVSELLERRRKEREISPHDADEAASKAAQRYLAQLRRERDNDHDHTERSG